ncbi:ATP-binding protein [Streptomyces anulatus]|uniref:ATP-binding protein n=1 Tax=Streptomyces anulatus TaxID=1892 RepID=UPI0013B5CE77|nr:ATP-binding protein [Streptomyces anulatus]NDZ57042.1 ATP-binding protein [Streptomyces anulatus]
MTCLHLPPVPASVRAARHWAAPLLPADVRDPVVLVISELVTNAVAVDTAAGTGNDIEVELVVDPAGRHVTLTVTDASDRPLPDAPVTVPADKDGGRGLLLVHALADDHGWIPRPCGGKRVWALFRSLAAPPRRGAPSPERLERADA